MDIVHAAQTASFSEFLDAYDPSRANAEVKGRSVLVGALTNAAPDARSAIANRLLDAGAGVNVVAEDYGTPLQLLMSQFAYTDETLAPFYDVLFARGELDLTMTGAFGKSAYAEAVKMKRRQGLRARMERHLTVHGIGIPSVVRGGAHRTTKIPF
ncbi:hypothetical protein [Streptomyces sp. NPDC014656]|uniref:hypothetical protein n=1 Tax=Streptomyces sp. NPDC014656 TaxID=3364878 RepID=UPI0036FFCABD